MGRPNTTLALDANFNTAVTKVLQGSPIPQQCTEECDLENAIRNQLLQCPSSKVKKCCKENKGLQRFESPHFKSTCEVFKSKLWAKTNCNWHNDIVANVGSNKLIVELKIVSKPSNFMCKLIGSHNTTCPSPFIPIGFNHIVPNRFHFKEPQKGSIINSPYGNLGSGVNYFSHLSEGQIWLDILRLKKAASSFSNPELYLLLACDDLNFNIVNQNLDQVIQHLDPSRGNYLYHNLGNIIYRSVVQNFEYNIYPIHPGRSGYGAFLVRIK